MTTYENVTAALADPNSNIAKVIAKHDAAIPAREQAIQRLMANGLTREQAWHELLFGR